MAAEGWISRRARSHPPVSARVRRTGPVRRCEAHSVGGVPRPAAARQHNDGSAQLTPVRAVTCRLPSGPAHARRPTDDHLALHVAVRPPFITRAPRRPPLHLWRIHLSNISSIGVRWTFSARLSPWLAAAGHTQGPNRHARYQQISLSPLAVNPVPTLLIKKWGQSNTADDLGKQRPASVICPHFF